MMFARIKPFVVYAVLFFLAFSGFYIRINNYRKSTTRTIDELVFYHLGAQLKNHFPEYHARGFSSLLLEIHPEFAPLPEYLTQPLFKHPPLFSGLISLALRLFGEHYYSAMYVSAFFGVMMIFLVYWIGTLSFDETTGLAAAFLVWLDPVNIISGQKIWMDTTASFFILLAVFFLIRGVKYGAILDYAGFGFASGCAFLTKYTGLLTLLGAGLYFVFFQRKILRRRVALLCFGVPALMAVPWLIWNYQIYGHAFFPRILALHNLATITTRSILTGFFVLGGLLVLFYGGRMKFEKIPQIRFGARLEGYQTIQWGLLGLLAALFLSRYIDIVSPLHLPETYWQAGRFGGEPWFFYFKRLPEFSLFYLVSYAAFFFDFGQKRRHGAIILKIFSGIILIFFSLWENYQVRYILAATPLLLTLSAALWIHRLQQLMNLRDETKRTQRLILAGLVSGYILIKTFYVNFMVSFPNDMCYF